MRKLLIVVLWLSASFVSANSDIRYWTKVDGSRFLAALASVDEEAKTATFSKDGEVGTDFTLSIDSLSNIDRAWVEEWLFVTKELEEKAASLGGTHEHFLTEGKYPTDLFVYQPSGVEDPKAQPMLILFCHRARPQRLLMQVAEAAENAGVTLVACGTFQNTDNNEKKEAEFLERFKEVLPQLEAKVPHDPKKMMMGGISGGAWRSYHYTAQVERPWLGVLAICGWLGTEEYLGLPYPAGMRVAIVNGDRDNAANRSAQSNSKILLARGIEMGFFAFEGGHQMAPTAHQQLALEWMLGQRMRTLWISTRNLRVVKNLNWNRALLVVGYGVRS